MVDYCSGVLNTHGITWPDAQMAEKICRPVNIAEEFTIGHGYGFLPGISRRQIKKSRLVRWRSFTTDRTENGF